MGKSRLSKCVPSLLALAALLASAVPAVAQPGSSTTAYQGPGGQQGDNVATVWEIETVDSAGTVGWDTSIDIDPAGRPHISYCRYGPYPDGTACDDLKYAWYDGTTWSTEVVDTEAYVGIASSLAVDSQGRPHIAYGMYYCFIGCGAVALKYARHDGTSWQIEVIESGSVGAFTSLALDSQDRPHISYAAAHRGLQYAWYDGSAWYTQTVAGPGLGTYTSIALDALDHPHITYKDENNYNLNYAWYDGSSWQIEVVDSDYSTGKWNSLVLDEAAQPRVTYYVQSTLQLKYAWRDGASWHTEVVDQSLGSGVRRSSLALDSLGRPRIAYAKGQADDDLMYAWHDGSSWHIETADSGGEVGSVGAYASLALDALDQPHISYSDDTNGDLRYALAPCVPVEQLSVSGPASLPTGVTGLYTATYVPAEATLPAVVWSNGTTALTTTYSWGLPGVHTVTVTVTNPCSALSEALTVTTLCQPVQGVTAVGPPTRLARQPGTYLASPQPITSSLPITFAWDNGIVAPKAVYSWTVPGVYTQTLTATNECGQSMGAFSVEVLCLPLQENDFSWQPLTPTLGQPVVLTGSARQVATGWLTETVERGGDVGQNTSLDLDSLDRPHIAYRDATNHEARYGYYDGTTWRIETVHPPGLIGSSPSLALDAADRPHVSFAAITTSNFLQYSYYDGQSWHTEMVDPSPGTGFYNSLELDAADLPHIAYYDSINYDLKYAFYDGANWHIEVVDSSFAGQFASLDLDRAGRPHISYYDYGNDQLKYARYDGAGWQIEVVDSDGWVGQYTALALDPEDRPHIAYYDRTPLVTGDLKYAFFDGLGWQVETVEHDIGGWGSHTSLAVDAVGHAHISYYDSNPGVLKYASHDGSSWQVQIVDWGADVGWFTSVALDAAGWPQVSYYDVANRDLRYARMEYLAPTDPLSYTWDLGDGTLAAGEVISHSYNLPGAYTVVLSATNCQGGGTASISHTLFVSGSIPCDPVHGAGFSRLPFTPTAGLPVTFTASASGTLPIAFSWDLGDGTWGAGATLTHTYANPGTYTVTVTATNCVSEAAAAVDSVTVVPPCDPVQNVSFGWTPLSPTVGQQVTFTGSASGTLPITFTWDFGDGSAVHGRIVAHTFTVPGDHEVSLTATNACGEGSAADTLPVAAQVWRVYLPLVLRR